MVEARRVRSSLVLLAVLGILLASTQLPSPVRAVTIGPGVVFRPSSSWGNLTFSSERTFTSIQVDDSGVTLDTVRFGFQKLPASYPGVNLSMSVWAPWQTQANTTSIGFTGIAPAGSSTYFNISNLVPLWEYDFYVDTNLEGVQFASLQGNVSFQWSLWSVHSFRIVAGARSAVTPGLSGSFTYVPSPPAIGRAAQFAAAASGGEAPYAFRWAFGDGSSALGSIASHAYVNSGNYVVVLSVSDASGQLLTLAKTVTVVTSPPSLGLTSDFTYAPSSPTARRLVSFSAVAGYGTTPYNFSWAFGDGFGSFGSRTTHVFDQPGSYDVNLTVTDSGGQLVSVVRSINVAPALPSPTSGNLTVAFGYSVDGTTVSFMDLSRSNAGLPIALRVWLFGDGSRSAAPAPVHTYDPGPLSSTYRAILVVCDTSNNCGSTYRDITFVNWPVVVLLVLAIATGVAIPVLLWRKRRRRERMRSRRKGGSPDSRGTGPEASRPPGGPEGRG